MMGKASIVLCATMLMTTALASKAEAQPVYGTGYTSSSGDTYVRHGYALNLTGAGSATSSNQNVTVPSGYDKAEIFLTGFMGEFTQTCPPPNLRQFKIGVEKVSYSGTTFTWRALATVRSTSGGSDAFAADFHFVIVLTKNTSSDVRTSTLSSCSMMSGGSCSATTTLTGAAPSGMDFAGVAIRSFQIERTDGSAGIPMHHMGVDLTSYSVNGTDVSLTHTCAFGDATPTGEDMSCIIEAVTFAAKNAETDNFARSATDSGKTSEFTSSSSDSAGTTAIAGVLGALAAWDLSFDNNGQHTLWKWYAGFKDISATFGATDFMNYTRMGFLGDTCNSSSTSSFTVINDLLKVLVL